MALIKTSAIISDIRGKLNGSVFQSSLGGLILRTKSGSINRRTQNQNYLRAGIKQLQSSWTGLSVAQRAAWNAYATYRNVPQKRNPTLHQSGQNLFIAENSVRWLLQDSYPNFSNTIQVNPVFSLPNVPTTISLLYLSTGNLFVEMDYSLTVADEYFYIKLSEPLRESQPSQYNKLKVMQFTQSDGEDQDITLAYIAAWGRKPAFGDWINFETSFGTQLNNCLGATTRGRIQVT